MKTIMRFILILCGASMTSCVTKHALSDGFYIKSTDYPLASEPGGGVRELHYRSSEGKHKVVWKRVGEVATHNEVAVFFGNWDGDEEYAGNCFFAAKGGGPVVRLRRAILESSAKKNGARLDDYLKRYGDMTFQETDDGVKFRYSPRFRTTDPDQSNPDNPTELSWNAISDMVDALVKTGKSHKDKLNGIDYLE